MYIHSLRDIETFKIRLTNYLSNHPMATVMVASKEFVVDMTNYGDLLLYLSECVDRSFVPWVVIKDFGRYS